MDEKQKAYKIKKISWIGIAANLLLSGIKFIVGYLGASHAVIADAVHSLSDMFTDFAVILGIKYWSAPPDENHPYGHQRIEAIVTIAIGLILVFVAFGIGYNAIITIDKVHEHATTWIAIIGPVLSILIKEILYQWNVTVGKEAKSSAVIANAWHHRSDALSSIPALIAVAAASISPDWAFIDHIGAVIISLFILKISYDIIRPSLSELADSGATDEDLNQIREISLNIDGVNSVHAIRTRKFGANLHVDLHVLVEPAISVRSGHDIAEKVKAELIKEGPDILDVIVHIEPDE